MSGFLKLKEDFHKDCNKIVPCDCMKDTASIKPKTIISPMLLFCGQGTDAQFTAAPATANVGFVTVDTTCLCKPLVKLKFSSLVNLSGLAALPVAQLTFSLSRTCQDFGTIILNRWVYDTSLISDNAVPLTFNTSFTFHFCDRLNCPRCCDYFVQASADTLANAAVSVTNVNMQAIAQ